MTAAFFEDGQADDVRGSAESAGAKPHAAAAAKRKAPPSLWRAGLAQSAASLLWIPQAALIASAVGRMADGGGLYAVLPLALIFLAIGIARAGLEALCSRVAFCIARAAVSDLREEAILALSRHSPLDKDRPASGFAASLLAEQAETIVPYFARYQPARLKAIVVPVALFVCVLPLSWLAALTLLVTAPLIPFFMALIGWRAHAASEKHLKQAGNLNAFLLDRLRGLATIRAFDAVETTALRLRAEAASFRQKTMAVLKIAFLSSAVLELFSALGVAAIAVYVGFSLLGAIGIGTWGTPLTLTTGLFILLVAPTFFEPLRELSAVWHDRATGEAALVALDAVSGPAVGLLGSDDVPQPGARVHGPAAIQINRLRFKHIDRRDAVFDGLDLAIAPGERVALLGASGSGKTTLLSLIAGLAPHEAGTIRIGGEKLDGNTAARLRTRMAWIGQRPHIFAGTLKGNITLGRPDIENAAITSAIDGLRLGAVANARRAAPIGEAGLGLSGGEALRLALARIAVDNRADIILADEPTAHLDAATAGEITDALIALAEGKTLVVATHDPLLAARLDRNIHLDALGGKDLA